MNIYLIAPDLRSLGGFEGQLATLAVGLAEAGHKPFVFIREPVDPSHPYWQRIKEKGIYTYSGAGWLNRLVAWQQRLPNFLLTILTIPLAILALLDAVVRRRSWSRSLAGGKGVLRKRFGRLAEFDIPIWALKRNVAAVASKSPPDIVDIQHSMIPHALHFAKQQNWPLIYTEYGAPDWALSSVWLGMKEIVNEADFVIGRAAASITGLQDLCCLSAQMPTAIIPNAVTAGPRTGDATNLALPTTQQPVMITAIGRLSPEKGTPYLLEAFKHLVAEGLPIYLVLAGDGPLREKLEHQIYSWQLTNYVKITGRFDTLEPIIKTTHIVAHPTLNDGRSVSVLEAMAWGRPVVGSAIGGVPELIEHDVNGFLVPPADVAALSKALKRLVVDETLRCQMGKLARERFLAQSFSAKEMVQETISVYHHVLKANKTDQPYVFPKN
ncbi:MAG: glycosyltransferase family 4 protein [Chloroflexota bacterium]